jgi:hypothetical protein
MSKSRNLSNLVVNDTGDILSRGIYQNKNTIDESYVVDNNYNGVSAGPIVVNSGVSVTIPSGSRWTIV